MSSCPSLSFDAYTKFSAFSPSDAAVYETSDPGNKMEFDSFAQFLLATLRSHPHVAVHGTRWKKRFKISKDASDLQAATQIFEDLHRTLRLRNRANLNAKLPPLTLNIETFSDLYGRDLAYRIQFFCSTLEFMMQERKFEEIRHQIGQCSKNHSDSDPTNHEICKEFVIQAIDHGWGDFLWYASASSNYWEAIGFLTANQIPIPLIDQRKEEITPLEIAKKLNHQEWVREFKNHLN